MRFILDDIGQAFHYWANKVQESGKASSVSFSDCELFSYSAMIGRHIPGAVVLSTQSYSVSTSNHQSQARQASRHLKQVFCNEPGSSARANMQAAKDAIIRSLADAKLPRIRQPTRDAHKSKAFNLARQANEYLAALPEDERTAEPIDTTDLEHLAVVAAEAQAKKEAELARMLKERIKRLGEDALEWLAGMPKHNLGGLPVMLRLSRDDQGKFKDVETSHGAKVPVHAAIKLWPLVCRTVRSGKKFDLDGALLGPSVGVYRLHAIHADGTVVIGCHTIPLAEMAKIAQQLHLKPLKEMP